MTDTAHLTEAERQTLADGSLPPRRAHGLEAHLRVCASCAADVARLKLVARRYAAPPPPDPRLAELWPEIRSRIERSKLVPLDAAPAAAPKPGPPVFAIAGVAAVLAAAVVAAALWLGPARRGHRPEVGEAPASDSLHALALVADSVRSYRKEAQVLLDRLELQRAMIRPEAMASIERDLRVIDRSIEELELAIERDPRNPALRQLLAASWRQKVELLKGAGNAL
jgi:hypothetical protein